MRLLFAACFSATLLVLIAIHCAKSGTAVQPIVPKMPDLGALFKNMPAPMPVSLPVVPASCKELYDKYTGKLRVQMFCTFFFRHVTDKTCHTNTVERYKKSTFGFQSTLWTNKNEFNRPGGKTGFDTQGTKLPTYWNTPFSKICLGMKIGQQPRFISINKPANSFYSLIADGQYRATSLGRNTWKMLIGSQASLQRSCNKEGFNAVSGTKAGSSKARIGSLGNKKNNCVTCDSRIGFGVETRLQLVAGT